MVKSKVPMNSYEEKGRQHQQQQEPHAGGAPACTDHSPSASPEMGHRPLPDTTRDSPPQSWEGRLPSRPGDTTAESGQRQDQLRGVQPVH